MRDKLLSARFLMAVIITISGCTLTAFISWKFKENKELVTFAIGQFFIIWITVIKDYFSRADRDKTP